MSLKPLCSVVIPSMEMATLLPAQLKALAGQTYQDFELLVVDNGSHDNTVEVANGFAQRFLALRVLRAQARRGPPHPRNVGLLEAVGTRILFCDADDVVCPTWVEGHLAGLDRYAITTGPVASLSDEALSSEPAQVLFATAEFTTAPFDVGPGLLFASTCNAGYRREVLAAVGGFPTANLLSDDVEVSLQARRLGFELGFVEDAKVLRRRRPSAAGSFRQTFDYGVGLAQLRREMNFTRTEVPSAVSPRETVSALIRLPLAVSARRRPWVARRLGRAVGELYEIILPGRRFSLLRRRHGRRWTASSDADFDGGR